jgi:hypothetical protein
MRLSIPHPRFQLALPLLVAFVIDACRGPSPFEVYGPTAGTFSIVVGQELIIEMGIVGPAFYVSPPTLSGSPLEFIGENAYPSTFNSPAGEPQLFHFKGVAFGQTIITFHGQSLPDVVDTVMVR